MTSIDIFFLLVVLHSGEYYLFESDSEDEEELQSEEQKPQKQTACQVRRTTRSRKITTFTVLKAKSSGF